MQEYSLKSLWDKYSQKIKPTMYSGNSYYIDLSQRNVKIYDEGSSSFVKCLKLIKNFFETRWYEVTFSNGESLKLTPDHPLYLESGRTEVKDIVIGSKIKYRNSIVEVTSIEQLDNVEDSYDVETESDRFQLNGFNSGNCRTRVIGNINGPEQTTGRGNFAFTTLNIPAMAIRAVRSSTNPDEQMANFWKDLDDKLRIASGVLIDRFKIICDKTYQNFPFLMQNGVYLTSDDKPWEVDTKIGDVLKQASLSIGYIGIYETCKVLLNKTLGIDPEAQELGLKIVKHIRDYCDNLQEATHLNWSTFATPAENLCGRFANIDKKRYGIIEDVTDKGYYTNSHMLPFDIDTTLVNKIKTEAPYHELTNAGHIFYYKVDGNPLDNVEAVEHVIMAMYKGGLGYFTITMDVDECPNCGYHGIIGDECPHCHIKDNGRNIVRIRRITGYLIGRAGYSITESWNNGKLAELKRRKNI